MLTKITMSLISLGIGLGLGWILVFYPHNDRLNFAMGLFLGISIGLGFANRLKG